MGETRECKFRGVAEYETIASIKTAVEIPVLANGDIDSPQKALSVLKQTNADGLMIGRAAQGRPWIFASIAKVVSKKVHSCDHQFLDVRAIILAHLESLYSFYGEEIGVRVARKHLTWYFQNLVNSATHRGACC